MISVEWEQNQTCSSCEKEHVPHIAVIDLPVPWLNAEFERTTERVTVVLCSDCVEDLKKRLS